MVYTFKFDGHWPVGACGYVVANDKGRAFDLVKAKLAEIGLASKNKDFSLSDIEVADLGKEHVTILLDGNY